MTSYGTTKKKERQAQKEVIMKLEKFTELTIGTQLVELVDVRGRNIIFIGTIEKLRQNKELLEKEIKFLTSFDYPNRLCIRIK